MKQLLFLFFLVSSNAMVVTAQSLTIEPITIQLPSAQLPNPFSATTFTNSPLPFSLDGLVINDQNRPPKFTVLSGNLPLHTATNYADQLPFFCKIEFKMEQKTKIPVRFRLGSVDYVDRLEKKY